MVEFALVIGAFLGMVGTILFMSFHAMQQQQLDALTQEVARIVRISSSGQTNAASFKNTSVCRIVPPFLSCDNLDISVDVLPPDPTQLYNANFTQAWCLGGIGDVLLVRTRYRVPAAFLLTLSMAGMSNGQGDIESNTLTKRESTVAGSFGAC